MKFLIDTSVWLEVLLDQSRAADARRLLQVTPLDEIAISDFSLLALRVILNHLDRNDVYAAFAAGILDETPIVEVGLEESELNSMGRGQRRLSLGFHAAYQYLAARKHGLTLVSFDGDLDYLPEGRRTPGQVLHGVPEVVREPDREDGSPESGGGLEPAG